MSAEQRREVRGKRLGSGGGKRQTKLTVGKGPSL